MLETPLAESKRRRYNGGMKPRMGTFFAECVVSNQIARERRPPRRLLVDTGSELTWIASEALRDIGVTPEKIELFELADGKTVSREVGFALINAAGPLPAAGVLQAEPV